MKSIFKSLVLSLIFGLLGWILGYLNFPDVRASDGFWLGFILALSISLFFVGLVILRTPNSKRIRWILLIGYLLMISFGSYFYLDFNEQKKQLNERFLALESKQQQQIELNYQQQYAAELPSINALLKKIKGDSINPMAKYSLKSSLIDEVANLAQTFEDLNYLDSDTVGANQISLARGRLLIELTALNIDDTSWQMLLDKVNFSQSDLRNTDLSQQNLQGIDLERANLCRADLSGSQLGHANLKNALMSYAKMTNTNFQRTDLQLADLKWVNAKTALFDFALIGGVNFMNARLSEATFQGCSAVYTNWSLASLFGANFYRADLFGGNFKDSDLRNTNLKESRLRHASLTGADLKGAAIDSLVVDPDWLDKYSDWHTKSDPLRLDQYIIFKGNHPSFPRDKYYLKLK